MMIHMTRFLTATLIAGLPLLAACGGSQQSDPTSTTTSVAATSTSMGDMSSTSMEGMDHEHGDDQVREWDGPAQPLISLAVSGDSENGWTGTVEVTDFVIDDAGQSEPFPGHGHVHVTVDGQAWGMVYEPTFDLPDLEPGTHTIAVTLSTNDHLEYVIEGQPIQAQTTIEITGGVPAAYHIDVVVADGQVTVTPEDPQVAQGDLVEIEILSDVEEEVHVHGYDLMQDLVPGEPAVIRFIADVQGIFEAELEGSATPLFELTVS